MVDGAGPLRILRSVIIPQALPAIVAVGLFQFFFSWNDFMGPLIYLAGNADRYPVSLGVNYFTFTLQQGGTNGPGFWRRVRSSPSRAGGGLLRSATILHARHRVLGC